jgi:hypothetical protein
MVDEQAKPSYTTGGRKATKLTIQGKPRTMKSYHVMDVELNSISSMNSLATIFFSLCGSSFAAAFSLWSSMEIDSSPTANALAVMPILEKVFVCFGVLFLVLAVKVRSQKESTVDVIRRESEDT